MKVAVRYQSIGGNTKAVAEAIAKAAGVNAQPISVAMDEQVDVLFIGGGVYKWDLDESLIDFLQKIDPTKAKSLAAFSTAGGMNGAKRIIAIAKDRGINVCNETLPVIMGVRNHGWFSSKGHIELNNKQIYGINAFVKKIMGQ